MRVLVFSQYYHPEPIFKPHELAVELRARGHDVTVVTGFPNYPAGSIYQGYRQRIWMRDSVDGIPVVRLPLYPDHSRSAARRILNYASFALSAAVIGTMLIRRADVVYVWHPPLTVGLPAVLWRFLRGIPFVYDVQDIWPDTVVVDGMVRNRRFIEMLQRLEKMIYRFSPGLIVQTAGARENLVRKGATPQRVHVLPNWSDERLYRPIAKDETLAVAEGMAGRFNVVFAGNMGAVQGLHVVLDAAERLRHLTDVQFVLIGDGGLAGDLTKDATARQLTNVRFLGRRSPAQMPSYFALADALLVNLLRRDLFRMIIPSKTTSYMACARPILMGVEGDAAALVERSGCGIAFEPENPDALAAAVERLYRMRLADREAMGNAGRAVFEREFTRAALIPLYEQVLEKYAGRAAVNSVHPVTRDDVVPQVDA